MFSGLNGDIVGVLGWPDSADIRVEPVQGGDINQCFRWSWMDGQSRKDVAFVKIQPGAPEGFFAAEAEGLRALSATGVVRVADVRVLDSLGRFLVLEWIDSSRSRIDYRRFGAELATMHRIPQIKWGWKTDNFLGTSVQKNGWFDDWWDFFSERRLFVQMETAARSGFLTGRDTKVIEVLASRLASLFSGSESGPSLLHGDLWSGNHLGEGARGVLIDPSVSCGDREADVAMTELFGGYPPSFYEGYSSVQPLSDAYEEKREIYNLYHWLNHLNLFGTGYLPRVSSVLRRFQH